MGLYTALCNMSKYNREHYFANHTFTVGEVEDCIEDMGKNKRNFRSAADMLDDIKDYFRERDEWQNMD